MFTRTRVPGHFLPKEATPYGLAGLVLIGLSMAPGASVTNVLAQSRPVDTGSTVRLELADAGEVVGTFAGLVGDSLLLRSSPGRGPDVYALERIRRMEVGEESRWGNRALHGVWRGLALGAASGGVLGEPLDESDAAERVQVMGAYGALVGAIAGGASRGRSRTSNVGRGTLAGVGTGAASILAMVLLFGPPSERDEAGIALVIGFGAVAGLVVGATMPAPAVEWRGVALPSSTASERDCGQSYWIYVACP